MKIVLLFMSAYFFTSTAFATHLDNENIVVHPTCSLAVNYSRYYEGVNSSEMVEVLSRKGYRPTFSKENIVETTDLSLSISEKYLQNGHISLSGKLAYTPSNDRVLKPISQDIEAKEIKSEASNSKFKKLFRKFYNGLPDCVSLDSGHSWDEEKYNTDIVNMEMRLCDGLYKRGIQKVINFNDATYIVSLAGGTPTALSGVVLLGNAGKGVGIAALGTGAVVGTSVLALGATTYFGVKAVKKKHMKNMIESRQFIANIESCYSQIQNGQNCGSSDLLTEGLSKKSKKLVNKYLQHATQEELTQRVADYLGSTRVCSENAGKIRKVKLKKFLKDVRKVF